MDSAPATALSQKQGAVASCIFRVILNDVGLVDDHPDLGRGDHAVGPRHLAYGMRQEQQSLSGAFPN